MGNNIFANKKAAKGSKVEEDFIGGGGFTVETDIYPAEIKYVYTSEAANSKAQAANICLIVDGKEITRQIWMTNKNGDITYKAKKAPYEEHNLPGYNQVNSLAMLLLSKEIGELDVEERTMKLYDFTAKAEINQAVPCFIDLHGLKLQVAIQKQIIDKDVKNESTGEYEPSGETRIINEFIKFFPEDKLVTISEIQRYVETLGGDFDDVLAEGDLQKAIDQIPEAEGVYAETWLEKNRGETYDKSTGAKKASSKAFEGSKSSGGDESKAKAKKDLFG